jgi:hypothetical protein
MHNPLRATRACILVGLLAALSSHGVLAGSKMPAGPRLDNYLPAKLAGWLTDAPEDAEGMSDHSAAVTQSFSSRDQESGIDIQIQRIDNRSALPKLEKAKLGQLAGGGGFATLEVIKDHKALLVYDAGSKTGKLTLAAGKCVVVVDGAGVSQAQLTGAAGAVNLKGLDAACQ